VTDPGPVYISLDEWLFVAAEILQVDPGTIHRVADLGLADSALHAPAAGFGDHEAYPDLIDKAAVLAVHLVKNHALPDANKRTSFITMIVFLKRNGRRWAPPGRRRFRRHDGCRCGWNPRCCRARSLAETSYQLRLRSWDGPGRSGVGSAFARSSEPLGTQRARMAAAAKHVRRALPETAWRSRCQTTSRPRSPT